MKRNTRNMILGCASVLLTAFSAQAQQRVCDLKITLTSPAEGAIIGALTSYNTTITLENLGPDNLIVGDTLYYNTSSMPMISYAPYVLLQPINAGASASVTLAVSTNSNDLSQDETMSYAVTVKSNLANSGGFIDTANTSNNTDANTVTFKAQNPTNSVIEVSAESIGLSITPNPTHGNITLTLNNDVVIKNIAIVDISGKMMFQPMAVNSSKQELNLSNLSNGMYFVKIETNKGIAVSKVIKQ